MSAAARPQAVLFCQPTAQRSGSEHSLVQILSALDRDLVQPFVLVGESGPMVAEFQARAAEVFEVRAPKLRRNPLTALRFLWSFPQLAFTLRRLRRAHGLAVVHVNTLMFPQAILAARLAGLPVLTHIREVQTTYPRRIYNAYFRFAALLSTRLVPVCAYILGQELPLRRTVDRKATVVHNASDHATVEPRALASPLRLVSVLPVTVKKGVLDLVEALGVLRELRPELSFELEVVGKHREPETLKAARDRLAELGLAERVEFVGEKRDVAPHLARAHVLVHPSHTEAFPRVLVEAMNAGLPCVATDVGGSSEAVEHGLTGYLVPAQAPRELARSLAELSDDEKVYAGMARAALDRYLSNFTPEVMGRAIEQVIARALDRSSQPAP